MILYCLVTNDLVLNQYLIEDLINIIESLTKAVNDIQVHRLVLLLLLDIVVINHQPITSMSQCLFYSSLLIVQNVIIYNLCSYSN